VQRLILHEDKLENFTLQIRNINAFYLEYVETTFLANQRLAHIEEAFRMHKLATRTIEFSQLAAVI
jgi:hypothetical protein